MAAFRKALSWCYWGVCRAHAAPSYFIIDGTTRVADHVGKWADQFSPIWWSCISLHRRLRCQRAGQAAGRPWLPRSMRHVRKVASFEVIRVVGRCSSPWVPGASGLAVSVVRVP